MECKTNYHYTSKLEGTTCPILVSTTFKSHYKTMAPYNKERKMYHYIRLGGMLTQQLLMLTLVLGKMRPFLSYIDFQSLLKINLLSKNLLYYSRLHFYRNFNFLKSHNGGQIMNYNPSCSCMIFFIYEMRTAEYGYLVLVWLNVISSCLRHQQ